jgi:hypothetical protein
VYRPGLPFPKLLDQRNALLKLRSARLELRDLLNDALEPLCLGLSVDDLLIEIGRIALE